MQLLLGGTFDARGGGGGGAALMKHQALLPGYCCLDLTGNLRLLRMFLQPSMVANGWTLAAYILQAAYAAGRELQCGLRYGCSSISKQRLEPAAHGAVLLVCSTSSELRLKFVGSRPQVHLGMHEQQCGLCLDGLRAPFILGKQRLHMPTRF